MHSFKECWAFNFVEKCFLKIMWETKGPPKHCHKHIIAKRAMRFQREPIKTKGGYQRVKRTTRGKKPRAITKEETMEDKINSEHGKSNQDKEGSGERWKGKYREKVTDHCRGRGTRKSDEAPERNAGGRRREEEGTKGR